MPRTNFAGASAVAIAVIALTASARGGEITGGTSSLTGNDVIARFFHAGGVLDEDTVLVSGGMGLQIIIPPSLASLPTLAFYDVPTGVFSTTFTPTGGGAAVTPLLAVPRSSHTQTTLLDGRVLFTGGDTGASGMSIGAPVDSVEIFDPVTGQVATAAPMSAARSAHTATRLSDGRVLVAGGATWQVYVPGGATWTTPVALQRTRRAHAAVLLPDLAGPGGDRVLLVGGSGTGAATLELIDPVGMTSALRTATLTVGVDDLAAARMDDDRVLIVGGQNQVGGDTVGLSYLYDPIADTLTPVAAPPNRPGGIADHELVRLGGYALVFGGEEQVAGVDTELDYVAIWDHDAGLWIFDDHLVAPHDDFASAVLPDERVLLVSGGIPFVGQTIPSFRAELFTATRVITADVTGDGVVNVFDLLAVLGAWGPCPPPPCIEDVTGDGVVNVFDLLAVLAGWGSC